MFHKPSAKQKHIRVPVLALAPGARQDHGSSGSGSSNASGVVSNNNPQQHEQQQQQRSLALVLFPQLADRSHHPFYGRNGRGGAGDGDGDGCESCDGGDARDFRHVIKAGEGLCHHPHLPHAYCLSPTSSPLCSSLHGHHDPTSSYSQPLSEPLSPTLLEEIYVLVLGAMVAMVDDLAARAADKGQALALSPLLDPGNTQHYSPHTTHTTSNTQHKIHHTFSYLTALFAITTIIHNITQHTTQNHHTTQPHSPTSLYHPIS